MEKKKYDVEFHGTSFFALVPLLLFVVFCILFFVVFKTFDMMHLCMGGYVALIIGSLLSKNWGKYWDAVAVGMSSKIMNELALILLIVGMFGKLMTRGGVAQGFVWLGDMIGLSGGGFTAFTFVATCIIATATGTSIGTMFTAFPILYPSGLLLGAGCQRRYIPVHSRRHPASQPLLRQRSVYRGDDSSASCRHGFSQCGRH